MGLVIYIGLSTVFLTWVISICTKEIRNDLREIVKLLKDK